ncbi:tRNA-dependent cyclodipeptide synthase [Streptomyces sp. NPDC056682]|uniref:tRNA-dependent cyclodipeptide synthase n=1 Tax=Streptomyces sp. NPDC056682 TaxID=3345909 RepID=UPI0036A84F83
MENRTKASFGKQAEGLTLDGARTILLVSVGQRYHEADKLRATVDLINRSGFGLCTIAVADTLQRNNYIGMSEDEAYAHSLRAGDEWLTRNAEILGGLEVEHEVLRWDEALAHEDYAGLKKLVEDKYHTDPVYRGAVNSTIGKFMDRLTKRDENADLEAAFNGCLTYLIEECPIIMPLWAAQGYDTVIYPQPMTSAMAMTYELFVRPFHPGKGNWLSLKFKKRAQAAEATA